MTYLEILNKWAEYIEYDPNQKSFNLLSHSYELHRVGEMIGNILDYDESGALATIYAKQKFKQIVKDCKVSAWEALSNPNFLFEEKDMYNIFYDKHVQEAENEFIGNLQNIHSKITKEKLIGEEESNEKQIQKILNCLSEVIESIGRCNVDLFKKGGIIQRKLNVNTHIHIFESLLECLVAIENAEDGMYLCYIRAGNSADCFFGFFIKSNGTILSVNDRVDEAYIGQHRNSRNGRWTEGKVDSIFPYDYIFHYSGYDYKGYATKYIINEDKLNLYNLGISGYMPIVIAMFLILLKYGEKELDMPLHFIDSLVPMNQLQIKNYEIMDLKSSNIATLHNSIDLFFDLNKLISGKYAEEFAYNSECNINEYGYFSNSNQFMVDLWSEGFTIDTDFFNNGNIKSLINKSSTYFPEFVGSEKRIRLQAYVNIRKQLADYMNDKIYQSWIEFGKTDAVKKWYRESILERKHFIYKMFYEYEKDNKNRVTLPDVTHDYCNPDAININTQFSEYPSGYGIHEDDILGCIRDDYEYKFLCDVNKCKCNVWFIIRPRSWKDIEYLIGKECIKIVKGWLYDGHRYSGNSLLNVTDPVDVVCTPFEYRHSFLDTRYSTAFYNFTVAFGFSKRGWNKIKKQIEKEKF